MIQSQIQFMFNFLPTGRFIDDFLTRSTNNLSPNEMWNSKIDSGNTSEAKTYKLRSGTCIYCDLVQVYTRVNIRLHK